MFYGRMWNFKINADDDDYNIISFIWFSKIIMHLILWTEEAHLRFVSAEPTRTLPLWPWRVFQIVIIIIIKKELVF